MFNRSAAEFGAAPNSNEEALLKSLSAGSGAGHQSSGGRSLVYEDLEGVLHSTTFGQQQFDNTLWKILKKAAKPAKSTIHEFNSVTGRGRTGVFGAETATVNEMDVRLKRKFVQMRFMRIKYKWTHVIGFTDTQEDPKTIQAQNATLALLDQLERTLYEGENAMVGDEMDGLYALVKANAAANIKNLNGQKPTKDDFLAGAATIGKNYGRVSHSFHDLDVQRTLDNLFEGDKDRVDLVEVNGRTQLMPIYGGMGIRYGAPAAGLRTSFGNIKFSPHLFVGLHKEIYKDESDAEAASSSGAPGTPSIALAVAAEATSKLAAGTYRYRVSAENARGESIPCAASTATATVSNGEKITVTITAGTGTPTCYRIYRSPVGGASGSEELIGRVAHSGGGGSYVDLNQRIAGTKRIFLCDLESPGPQAALAWAQLANMGSYELPMLDTEFQALIFLYGALTMYAPGKVYILDNVAVD
jgi:hypothetical protein